MLLELNIIFKALHKKIKIICNKENIPNVLMCFKMFFIDSPNKVYDCLKKIKLNHNKDR